MRKLILSRKIVAAAYLKVKQKKLISVAEVGGTHFIYLPWTSFQDYLG